MTDPDAPRVVLPGGLTTALGGPRGAFGRPGPRGVARLAPVVLLLGLPLLVASLRQSACAAQGYEGQVPVWRMCASPMLASVTDDGAGRGVLAYLSGDAPLDVPVVPGTVTTLLATLAPGAGLEQQRWVLVLWTLTVALLLAGLVVAVGTVRRHRAADPVALALSPVLALTVLLSAELVPVALATVAVRAWSRRRPGLAGALAGVAVLGARPAVLVLLALALTPPDGLRHARRRLLGSAAATVVIVLGPLAALDPDLVVYPLREWWAAGAGPGSPWFVPTLAEHPLGPSRAAVLSLLGLLLATGLVLLLAARGRRPATADLALVGLLVALATGVAYPVQTAVWLVPFVALAGVRWREHLLWAGAEVVHAVALHAWLAAESDPAHGLPAGWYATALVLRLLALGRLGWVVWSGTAWSAAGWDADGPGEGAPDGLGDGAGRPVPWTGCPPGPVDNSRAVWATMHTLLSRKDRDRHRPKEAG
ncbi:hypothetical protein JQN72_04685 [Phycicoccus sp. CSK15P-2]|uniref:hypothetical protein n=1 Tax=Phycicoccus sp. CSK15P-2 TaxID=2807627 RepID=UPI001950CF21|nr:hypothetical protein [Phycicoccus sp. CSK15P-2]MBM6403539.1 hypothetical protein [Phycicoccus sp. CSK15P-2]